MALTKAQRDARRRDVADTLRRRWRSSFRGERDVVLTLQDGRRRPRVSGRLRYVATSGAYVLLDDGCDEPLHVPLERVVSVR